MYKIFIIHDSGLDDMYYHYINSIYSGFGCLETFLLTSDMLKNNKIDKSFSKSIFFLGNISEFNENIEYIFRYCTFYKLFFTYGEFESKKNKERYLAKNCNLYSRLNIFFNEGFLHKYNSDYPNSIKKNVFSLPPVFGDNILNIKSNINKLGSSSNDNCIVFKTLNEFGSPSDQFFNSINFCRENDIKFSIIEKTNDIQNLILNINRYSSAVYMPSKNETIPPFIFYMKLIGKKIITNKKIHEFNKSWFFDLSIDRIYQYKSFFDLISQFQGDNYEQ